MPRFPFSAAAALVLTLLLWALVPAAHGHHGGGGHGGFGYGGHHGFGYGGYHHGFHGYGYGYGYRGFGFGGFGYPFFGGFGYPGFGFGGLGYGMYGLGGLGYGGLGYGGLGYGGLGFGGLGYGGLGYGGLGFGGLGYGGLGFRGFGSRGYGYGGCNCCCLSAYPSYGGSAYPIYGGGTVPAAGGGGTLPMPRGVSSASRYVEYYARNSNPVPATATASNTSASRYVDYYARNGAPTAENKALLRVSLPADAELWLNGKRMTRTGAEREFITPQLQEGETYAYQVKARWTQDGKPLEETIEVKVRANKTTNVALGTSALAKR